jgi:hypothetical protein
VNLSYPELPLLDSPQEGLEDRANWRPIVRRLDTVLRLTTAGLDPASCARRLLGVLRALNVEVVLFKAGADKSPGRTDSSSGVKRATFHFDQPEAAGRKLAAGSLPFVGYEDLWLDLATLAAHAFLEEYDLPLNDDVLLDAVRDYLFVPGSVVRAGKHRSEATSSARRRIWCYHNLPMAMFGAHKRPGRKSFKAHRRVDIPSSYRKRAANSPSE